MKSRKLPLIIAALASLFSAGTASAQWIINRPGSYELKKNYNVRSGDGIVITASNVTLNLNGHTVSTSASGTGRGIVVQGAKGVSVTGGKVAGFNMNLQLAESSNVTVEKMQVIGGGLAPNNGPTEIGIVLVNSWGNQILSNTVTGVNLGIFVRGEKSSGNRIAMNVVTGGATAANNLLGICYNPAPTPAGGTPNPAGPRGDSVYNNQITRFGYAIAVSEGSISNVFTENVLSSFTGGFREPQFFSAGGGTNEEFDNTAVTIPATNL